ncbi:hypothetical protein [Alkalimarinus coralli]|uniref:hypothetical protein n=1 Tax=Alkalimarinus coralli TaxID=2935863 RepID=UPI00202B125D|nr:hypothetical protein [Alkalimarinus coralli]
MTTVIIFSILGGLLLLSIIFSSLAHKRQQALSLKKAKINQLGRSISDLQETLNTVLQVDSSYDLILILHQQVLTLIEKKLNLDPDNQLTQQLLEQQKLLNSQYRKKQRPVEVCRVMVSDEAINLANFQLLQATKLLNKFKLNKKISPAKFSELSNHIQRLKLDIEVESHIAQADRYLESKDIVMTQSHLKQARESLRAFPLDFPEKSQLIRTLSERIKNINKTNAVQISDNPPPETENTNSDESC